MDKQHLKAERMKQKALELEIQQKKMENDFVLQQRHLNLEEKRLELDASERCNNMKLMKSVAYLLKTQATTLSQSQQSNKSQPERESQE